MMLVVTQAVQHQHVGALLQQRPSGADQLGGGGQYAGLCPSLRRRQRGGRPGGLVAVVVVRAVRKKKPLGRLGKKENKLPADEEPKSKE